MGGPLVFEIKLHVKFRGLHNGPGILDWMSALHTFGL